MVQGREHARFAFETGEPMGIGRERRRQQLDRDLATEFGVAGAIDLAHPAAADLRDDVVRTEPVAGRGHARDYTVRLL
jgi:hypothetical protein